MHDVRLAVPGDMPGILAVYADAGIPDLYYCIDDLTVLMAAPDRCIIAVAEAAGAVIGFAVAYDMILWGYIDIVAVSPFHRKAGVGRSLLAFVAAQRTSWLSIAACHHEGNQASWCMFNAAGYGTGGGGYVWRFYDPKGQGMHKIDVGAACQYCTVPAATPSLEHHRGCPLRSAFFGGNPTWDITKEHQIGGIKYVWDGDMATWRPRFPDDR